MGRGQELLEETIAHLPSIGKVAEWERGGILLAAGQVERQIHYVEKGLIRLVLQAESEEHTIRFGYQGSLIVSISSFLRQEPSQFFMEAIRKSLVWAIEKETWEEFVAENASRKAWYLELMEEIVSQHVEREIDLLTASPQERLNRVLQRSPALFQEVPSKYIASYLRMSPETLSRIRNS